MSPCTNFLYTTITFSSMSSSFDFLRPSAVSSEVFSSPVSSSSLGRKAPACVLSGYIIMSTAHFKKPSSQRPLWSVYTVGGAPGVCHYCILE